MTVREEGIMVRETLAWCNEQRAARGLGLIEVLPKGARNDPESCPCGAATGLYVDHESYADNAKEWERGNRAELPGSVADFVHAFDIGHFPEFEDKG